MRNFCKFVLLLTLAVVTGACKKESPASPTNDSYQTGDQKEKKEKKEVKPSALFTYEADDMTFKFKNLSSNATQYKWSFGNGDISYAKNPTYTYKLDRPHTVTLTAYYGTLFDEYSAVVEPTDPEPVIKFKYEVVQPMTVVLTNLSENIDPETVSWTFGDDETSTEFSPKHKYKSKGAYKIILSAISKGGTKFEANVAYVTITEPTQCYFAGLTYEKLSVNNEYVKFKVIDDDIFTTTWVNSSYTLLSKAILPYSFILKNPVLMNGLSDDEYYDIQLYYSTTGTGDGTLLDTFRFRTSTLLTYPESLYWNESKSGNKVTCYFIWR